jgi:hypothetical protein
MRGGGPAHGNLEGDVPMAANVSLKPMVLSW